MNEDDDRMKAEDRSERADPPSPYARAARRPRAPHKSPPLARSLSLSLSHRAAPRTPVRVPPTRTRAPRPVQSPASCSRQATELSQAC